MQNVLKRKNMYFVKKFQKLMFYDLLICIIENIRKKIFLGGVRKKTGFCLTGGGGSERYAHFRNFLRPSLRKAAKIKISKFLNGSAIIRDRKSTR